MSFLQKLLYSIVPIFTKKLHDSATDDNVGTDGIEKSNPSFNMESIYQVFPRAKREDIDLMYPLLVKELEHKNIFSRDLLIYCLATISAEDSTFNYRRTEIPSKFSTKSGQKPYDFSKYDELKILGSCLGINVYYAKKSPLQKDKKLPKEFYRNRFC
jgi:hypothetical protein